MSDLPLLYRLQGICVYTHQRKVHKRDHIELHFRIPLERCSCPEYKHKEIKLKEWRKREFIGAPLDSHSITLVAEIPKITCPHCGAERQVKISFARRNKHYTKRFEAAVIRYLETHMSLKEIAKHFNVSWDIIRSIDEHRLEVHYSKPSLKGLRYIAIDEIAIRKGHNYLTLVMNLENGQIVYIGDGRHESALKDFWKKLKRARAHITAVASDMSRPFTKAIRENLPNAVHVFDRFHIVKMFNDTIDQIRRSIYRRIKDKAEKLLVKGTRYILFKRRKDLNTVKGEVKRLEKALKANEDLSTAYYLKEELYSLWEADNIEMAQGKMKDLISFMQTLKNSCLKRFAKTLITHFKGVLAWYDHKITTGPLEGVNNKIKTIKRIAYGFRNMKYFKLKIFACHTK